MPAPATKPPLSAATGEFGRRVRQRRLELEIAAGRLVAPYPALSVAGDAYWLAFPEGRRNVPKIKAFRDWVAGEIRG